MVDSNIRTPGEQDLILDKTGLYGRLDDGSVHDGGRVDASCSEVGGEDENLLSIDDNSGLYGPVWFSNSSGAEQTTALPIMLGGSSILEDEIWSNFLSQATTPSSPADPGSPLSGNCKKPEPAHSLGAKDATTSIADAPDELEQTRSSSDGKNTLQLNLTNQPASAEKSKAVHWPEEMHQEIELFKRLRSGVYSQSAAAELVSSMSKTDSHESGAQGDFEAPQQLEGSENLAGAAHPPPQSEFQTLSIQERLEVELGNRAGVDVTTTSTAEASGTNGLDSPGSKRSKAHAGGGDGSVGVLAMSASVAVAQALSGTNLLIGGDDENAKNVSPNLLQFKVLPPVKNGASPMPQHVQLMERNTGSGRILSTGTFLDTSLPKESRWAEQLLLECAMAISSENFVRTQHLMWVLNDLGCLTGDANQRLAAHGLKSLFCKVTGTGDAVGGNPALAPVDAGPKIIHRALLKFHDVNPWHHMVYTVANLVMIDNFQGEARIHVIDIGVSQGTQWPTFIEALATRASGPPHLRLTVIKDEERASTIGLPQGPPSTDFMSQLERFAKLMGINIELHTVVSSLENLTRDKLCLKKGEALAICAQFRLHRLSETTGKGVVQPPVSPRDRFLQFLHGLQPKVMILSENDTDHLSADFVTRFRPAVDYFWKFLDSTSFSFHGKQSQERQIIEYEAAMAMINNVACDGSQRIERNESHAGWTVRMKRARFVQVLPRDEILDSIKTLIKKYDANWEYGIDMASVLLLWKHQPVTFCSVWKPA